MAKEPEAKKQPTLQVRKVKDGIKLSLANAGRAGRIFLLNSKDELERVIDKDEFVDMWKGSEVANSARAREGDQLYLDSKVVVAPEDRDATVEDVQGVFKGLYEAIQSGALRTERKKRVIEVIPLL